ncbi:MAG TPA: J domain-containing protein [Blastocatellia bacterium]|nr:J domain-containing protein [Blastocatellia bacterium]
MRHKPDFYSILRVPPTATRGEIRSAYRTRAREVHPDQGGNVEDMLLLKRAYDVLMDPQLRDAYDSARTALDGECRLPFSSEETAPVFCFRRQARNPSLMMFGAGWFGLLAGLLFFATATEPNVFQYPVESWLSRGASVLFFSSGSIGLYLGLYGGQRGFEIPPRTRAIAFCATMVVIALVCSVVIFSA